MAGVEGVSCECCSGLVPQFPYVAEEALAWQRKR